MSARLKRELSRALLLALLLLAGSGARSAWSAKDGAQRPHPSRPHVVPPAERRQAVERWQKATPEERQELRQRYGPAFRSLPPEEKARLREQLRNERNAKPGLAQPPARGEAEHPPAPSPMTPPTGGAVHPPAPSPMTPPMGGATHPPTPSPMTPPAAGASRPPAFGATNSRFGEKPALRGPVRPMTPERREAIRQRVANLSPEQRQQLATRLQRFRDLPSAQQAAVRQHLHELQAMTPEERQNFRRNTDRWRSLAPEERQRLRAEWQHFQSLPPADQQRLLSRVAPAQSPTP